MNATYSAEAAPPEMTMPLAQRNRSRAHLALIALVVAATVSIGPVYAGDAKAGAAIVAHAVRGIGGDSLLDRVSTITVTGEATRETPNGPLRTPTRTFIAFPASFRQEIVINGGTVAMATSPEGAFLIAPRNTQPLSEAQKHNLETTALRIPLVLLKGRRQSLFSADADGTGLVGEHQVDFANVYIGNEHTRLAVDRATGRVVQQEFDTRGGVPERAGRMVVTYSDFRQIPYGITLPFTSTGHFEGMLAFTSRVDAVSVNDNLDESLFGAQGDSAGSESAQKPKELSPR